MYEVESGEAHGLLTSKKKYDIATLAVGLARKVIIDENDDRLVELLSARREAKEEFGKARKKVMKQMGNYESIADLGHGWYGVKFRTPSREMALMIATLNEADVGVFERDFSRQDSLGQRDIEIYMPGCTDAGTLEVYKSVCRTSAVEILESAGVEVVLEADSGALPPGKVGVTYHAMQRWVMRVLGVTGYKNIEEYLNSNMRAVENQVLEAWETSEFVWTGIDGAKFYLDPNNMVFVMSPKDLWIVTLYEADFKWSKHINRIIFLEHLKVLDADKARLSEAEVEFNRVHGTLGDEVSQLDSSILNIEGLIEDKEAEILKLKEQISQLEDLKRMKREDISAEAGKVTPYREAYESNFAKVFRRSENQ